MQVAKLLQVFEVRCPAFVKIDFPSFHQTEAILRKMAENNRRNYKTVIVIRLQA